MAGVGGGGRWHVVVLLQVCAAIRVRSDGSNHKYKVGDVVPIYANKVVPFHNPRMLLTFLPKSLFEQFRRVANFYFLVTGILSFTFLAPYSASNAIVPLIFVIGATMFKEFIEDWRQKQQLIPDDMEFQYAT